MGSFRLDQLLETLTGARALMIVFWLGLAALTITLLVLMRTRWGQSRALGKCVMLSVLAHLLFAGYATTVQIVGSAVVHEQPIIHVSFVDPTPREASLSEEPTAPDEPWEQFAHDAVAQPEPIDPSRLPPDESSEPERQTRVEPSELPDRPQLDYLAMAEVTPPEPVPAGLEGSTGRGSPGVEAETIEVPAAQRREPALPSVPTIESPAVPAADEATLSARARVAGVHTALVDQLGPLPRLTHVPVLPEPADALAGAIDEPAAPARTAPVETFARSGQDAAYGPGDRTASGAGAPGGAGRLHSPSIGELAGSYHGGGRETGLPPSGPAAVGPPRLPRGASAGRGESLPSLYRLRVAPDRSRRAQQHGATPESEAAVQAALRWLADNQSPDGRWKSSDHGGGRELLVDGRSRQGAGSQADTGMTGLSLLAFLAAGNTHQDGPYQENVRRGLEYLMRVQKRDGDLGGDATTFARMYCHAMAAFALSEAYAMTADTRLRQPAQRAVAYTLAAQSPTTGGWRYSPRDPGDTSQLGWQWMALKSAELAGLDVPEQTKHGIVRYLRTVSAGKAGGLASYRPNERVSPAMTAEAMVCWQFLGLPRTHPACNEAGDYMLAHLPGQGEVNFYYWYYATLAMFQLQDAHWERWNAALQKTLIQSQRKSGPAAGSWDPNCVWGGYGGRVYTTALGALCLEVYYRYLPLFVEASSIESRAR